MNDPARQNFLLQRAAQEREIALGCEDSAVALAHLRMAEEYERRARLERDAPQAADDRRIYKLV